MKAAVLTLVVLIAVAGPCRAEEFMGPSSWDYAYVDLHQSCQRYYSLYPPSVKCIEDKLYKVQFKITYRFHGEQRTALVPFIPGPQTKLDDKGNIIAPDYSIKDRS